MNDGRLDMAVRHGDAVYVFEFKVGELAPEGAAMAQLKRKGCAAKYLDGSAEVHLVAVEFSRETRDIVAFEAERAG